MIDDNKVTKNPNNTGEFIAKVYWTEEMTL